MDPGMAVTKNILAKENGAKSRNPEGTLLNDWQYPYYYRNYCTTLEHK